MTDLTEGNELKTILYFSVPIFLGNIFEQLYNVTDAAIVGNFIGRSCRCRRRRSNSHVNRISFHRYFNRGKCVYFPALRLEAI